MIRRSVLQGVFALGFGAASAAQRPAHVFAAVPARRTVVRLGYVGYPCEAVTFLAPGSPIFRRHGLDPHLLAFNDDAALIAALGAGTIDAASVKLATLLEPLASGRDIRVVAGLHAGCLRVLQRAIQGFGSLRDLRGQTIGTDRLHGPSMNLLAAILHREGIDPEHDVTWQAFAEPDLESALDAQAVAYVAAADPVGYELLAEHKAEPYLEATGGSFSCGGDIAPGHHCFLALSGPLVATRGPIARSLTRAFIEATNGVAAGVGPAAVAEAASPIAADIHAAIGVLSTYDWRASTGATLEELELTARDFRRAGLLQRATDPEELAARAFADVL